jgi:uncharacterized repeat protein (TIGR03847 family)
MQNMPQNEIVLDPVDFLTVGTVGPKGQRIFYLQAAKGTQLITLVIEKQQAQALGEAIVELLETLQDKFPNQPDINVNLSNWDMGLRDPIDALFRVAQMGLGYDEDRHSVVLIAQELVTGEEELAEPEPQTVRMWATPEQMRVLSDHAQQLVQKGRADPKSNGFMIYYWT